MTLKKEEEEEEGKKEKKRKENKLRIDLLTHVLGSVHNPKHH